MYKRQGPLHLAMAAGLPIVTTAIPALVEVTEQYSGIIYAEPEDARSLADAIQRAFPLVNQQFEDPHSWNNVASRYLELLNS